LSIIVAAVAVARDWTGPPVRSGLVRGRIISRAAAVAAVAATVAAVAAVAVAAAAVTVAAAAVAVARDRTGPPVRSGLIGGREISRAAAVAC
jgi:hypothetical protein